MSTADSDARPPFAQHDQCGSLLPASSAIANQLDRLLSHPGHPAEDPSLIPTADQVREHQQVDLAMLRLSFRKFYEPHAEEPSEPPKLSDETAENESRPRAKRRTKAETSARPASDCGRFTVSDFSHLVSAIAKLHEEERAANGVDKPIPTSVDKDREDYEQLSKLSRHDLIQLCHDNSIIPPDLCDPEDEPGRSS